MGCPAHDSRVAIDIRALVRKNASESPRGDAETGVIGPDSANGTTTGPERGTGLWLHFNLADARARNWLASCSSLPEQARETLLDGKPHLAVAPAGNGLAGVLGDLQYELDDENEDTEIRLVQFYVDEHCLITARRHPLRSLDRLRRDLREGLRPDGPAHLLVHLLEHLADSFADVATRRQEAIDFIEDRILDGAFADSGSELGRTRRQMARLRRQMAAQRLALRGLLPRLPGWWAKIDRSRLRQAMERIEAIAQDLELAQERARLLQDELQGRLGESTNRNLYFLSVLSAIFLPLTLITGIFGMNVPALPWIGNAEGFWWVMLSMGATFAFALLVLRWRRLL